MMIPFKTALPAWVQEGPRSSILSNDVRALLDAHALDYFDERAEMQRTKDDDERIVSEFMERTNLRRGCAPRTLANRHHGRR